MLSDDDFRRLLEHLDRPWAGFRKVRKGVMKRLRRHMQAAGYRTIEAYLDYIDHDKGALSECERLLTVTISRFFRDRQLWRLLQQRILSALARRFPGGLSAWSAGCASGEEPYSLAMIREMPLPDGSQPHDLRILATDADAHCLTRAREGLYPSSSLKEVPQTFRCRWFDPVRGGRQWKIDPALQEHIAWQLHHLLDAPPAGPFQLIFLRNNLLTYHRGPVLISALERILAVLSDGGTWIVGSHERLPTLSRRLEQDPACPFVYHARPQQ